jgi:hypothetical protein
MTKNARDFKGKIAGGKKSKNCKKMKSGKSKMRKIGKFSINEKKIGSILYKIK